MKKLYLIAGMCLTFLSTQAQTPTSTIQKYGNYLTTWMDEEDIEMRDKISQMCEGKKSCRVDDKLMLEFIKRSKEVLGNGDKVMDTYLNGFENLDGKTLFLLSNITQLADDAAPDIKNKKDNEPPLKCVTADLMVKNKDINFNGSDMFMLRGNMITGIVDNNNDLSIGKAIRLYSQHKYEEAFRMFRTLAYQDIFNYEAQYYLAVMEIKKQGCSYLSPKVRDKECLWFCTKPFLLTDGSKNGDKLKSFYYRFSMDERQNIYNGFGIYSNSFTLLKPFNEGLLPFKEKSGNKYAFGFMDETGNVVVPAKYGFAYPFGRNGLAIIQNGNKVCAIDKMGKEVVPFGAYDNMGRGFKNGNNVAHIGKTAYLINKEGSIIKTLVNGKEDVWCGNFYYGDYLVIGEGTDMKYIFDCEGNLFWKGHAAAYSINAEKGTITMGEQRADKIVPIKETEVPYNW